MNIEELQKKMIAVLGFGKEGKTVVQYLQKHGVSPTIFDESEWDELSENDRAFLKNSNLTFISGKDALGELKGFDVIFRSPGIPRLHPKILEAEKHGAIISSQTIWFFEATPATVIGVTGTNGKGTTCSLIYTMVNNALIAGDYTGDVLSTESHVYLTGNIGKTQPLEILGELTDKDIVVYELSSFQLQDLRVSPSVGVVLMVTSEHLDKHATTEEYVAAKESIVKYQTPHDTVIANFDFSASVKIASLSQGKKYYFSRKQQLSEGAYIEGENVVVIMNQAKHIFATTSMHLRGKHNLENVSAAALASLALGVGDGPIQSGIRDFPGLQHRLEFVTEHNGVVFIDDSISTSGDTAIAAISSFTQPLVLILGGSEKNLDFTELTYALVAAKNIKHLILVGQTGQRLLKELQQAGFSGEYSIGAQNMKEIFDHVSNVANTGDVVLLSPACASFGMFKNYVDRGNQFKEWAKKWQKH